MSDPIFKACTRPAMLLSVPMTPLLGVLGMVLLISVWTNYFTILTMIPIYIVMKITVSKDDCMFNLLFLKMKCRIKNQTLHFYRAAVYCPIDFKKRN